jgi:YjbR
MSGPGPAIHAVPSPSRTVSQFTQALRKIALRFPDVEEGVACKGTALECPVFNIRKKNFLFTGAAEARLKLRESLPEANKLASREPSRFGAGSSGWVTVRYHADAIPPLDLLERWIGESYRLFAPAPGRGPGTAAKERGKKPAATPARTKRK